MKFRVTLRNLVYEDGIEYMVEKIHRNSKRYQGDVVILRPVKRIISWLPYIVEPLPKNISVFYRPNSAIFPQEALKLLARKVAENRVDIWFPCTPDFLKSKRMRNLPAALKLKSYLHHQLNSIIND